MTATRTPADEDPSPPTTPGNGDEPARTPEPAVAGPATAIPATTPSGEGTQDAAPERAAEAPPAWGGAIPAPPAGEPSTLDGSVPTVAVVPTAPATPWGVVPPALAMPVAAPIAVVTATETLEEEAPRHRFLRRQKRPRHLRPRRPRRVLLVTLGIVVVLVAASAGVVVVRLHRRPPVATVRPTLLVAPSVQGTAPSIPWPTGVESALAIPALGINDQSGPEVPEPIASVTKIMNAHVILTDHPLAVGEDGPSITITSDDVALYNDDVTSGQTNIQVSVGEVLTERQLLEGMLVHSANNFADLLAVWDAGSISAFVTKMNAAAASLGMTQTTYADSSGYSPQSVSTAADQLRIAALDVSNPVFNQIVDMTSVTLPVAGTVGSYTPLLGADGVVGVKSGFTSQAGGCDVLALLQDVHGVPVEVLVSVVGIRVGDVLTEAGLEALSVAKTAVSGIRYLMLAHPGQAVAMVSAVGHSVGVITHSTVAFLAWPGQPVTATLHIDRVPRAGAPADWPMGSVTYRVGPQRVQVHVATGARLPPPTFLQRVF